MNYKILIVEKDENAIHNLKSLIEKYINCDILFSFNWKDASQIYQSMEIDFSIINFKALIENRESVEENIIRLKENSKYVFLVDNEHKRIIKEKNIAVGEIDYITLPIDEYQIIIKIKNQLALSDALKRENEELEEKKKEILRLQESIKEAERANYYKSIFLANMSHDIRTPVNGILGVTDLLQGTVLSTEQKEYVQLLKYASTSLNEIIDQILDISKIESGKMQVEKKEFNILAVTGEIAKLMEFKAKSKGINMNFTFEGNLERNVIGDLSKYKQILMNLLNNAIKFTDYGRIDLSVRATAFLDGNRQSFEIKVQDTGIGIEKENFKKIFKEFEQANPTINNKYGGTGLGLAIVKKLVDIMNGEIMVESAVGAGSTFILKLPFEVCEKSNISDQISAEGQLNQTKVLVVDDNEINRAVILKMLEKQGVFGEEAENGLEAVEKHRKNQYDVIFMDIQMPVMDGIEATKEIRESEKEGHRVRIIAVTACIITFDKEMCIEAGMDEYVIKPIKKDMLMKILN